MMLTNISIFASVLTTVIAAASAVVDVPVPLKFTFKFTTAGTQLDLFPDIVIDSTITMRNTGGPKPILTRDGARIAYDHATRGKISMFVWALGTTEVTFDPPTFVQGQPGHTFDGFRMYNSTLARNYKPSKPAADGPRRLWKACPAFAGTGYELVWDANSDPDAPACMKTTMSLTNCFTVDVNIVELA